MRIKIYLILLLNALASGLINGQTRHYHTHTDTFNFNYSYWNGVADKKQLRGAEREEFISAHKRAYLEEHRADAHPEVEQGAEHLNAGRLGSNNQVYAGPCTNIDFEAGNLSGWSRSCGFHPGFNITGCCPNPNGQQTIMTGAGLDPYGGFPVVFPGGNFSVRLGNNGVNGQADRLQQTFFVTQANANFTYRYAVVLNDAGHIVSQQPYFEIMLLDTLGAPIVCTQYTVAAGANNPGYFTSTLTANGSAVRYKPWTSVVMDLTPLIGQNVTLRFTTYDCSLGGHFGYAYVDGLCTNFATATNDTTCPGVPKQMCAPVGFLTYNWNGPGIVNNPNQCINATQAGTYTCTTVLIPGCPGPSFTHTLNLLAKPVLSYTPTTLNACSLQYSFASTSSISTGSITAYNWDFGDNTSSALQNPVHTFPGPGTYSVKFRAMSNRTCLDSVIQNITIHPFPQLSFSPPSNCVNTVVQFTNTSTIAPPGSIASYTWNLGNGGSSNLVNPATTYTANGTYTITLNATSNMGCPASLTQTLGIFPPPILSFSAAPLCDINGTSFTPATSTAIASGSLVSFNWNFGDGGTSNVQNPVHVYANPGTYTVSFTATSNHACVSTVTNAFIISPTPTVAFSTYSANACSPFYTFTNTSGIAAGSISYSWNFGGMGTSTLASPSFTFPGTGSYTISLTGVSNMGCADTAYHYITIYPQPVISFSVPSSCQNAIFTCSTTALSGSVTSYNWNFGDPGSGPANTSTLQNPTHVYPNVGNYTVQLNIISNLNCPSNYATQIYVHPNPVAAFSIPPVSACNTQYSFVNSSSVTPLNGDAMSSYTWNFGGGNSSSVFSPTYNFPAPGTYSVSMIATTNRNCMDTAYATVTIHPYPALGISMNPSCLNVPLNISSAASISPVPDPGASIVSYTWNFGDNTTANTATAAPHLFPVSNTYTVTYSATSNQGCVSTVTDTVMIYPLVQNTISAAGFCHGSSTAFSSTNTLSSGSISAYLWNLGDGNTANVQNPQHSYLLPGTYPVSYSVTSNNGCISVNSLPVTVNPLPAIAFTGNNACVNDNIQFINNTTINPGSISSYTWNFGDGSADSGQLNPAHTYTQAGLYTLSLSATSNQGCVNSGTGQVTSYPRPQVSFTAPATCMNSPMVFANTSSITSGQISSYTWYLNQGVQSASINPVYTYTAAGVYQVMLGALSDQNCYSSVNNTVLVHPQAAPDFSFTNVCFNNNTSFSGTWTLSTGTVTSSAWDFGDGSFGATASASHVYLNSGNFNVTFSTTTNNNCVSSITKSLSIFPLPAVNFSAAAVCLNNITYFSDLSSIPLPNNLQSWNWNFGDGSSSGIQNPPHTYTAYGSYTPTLTVTSNQNCVNTGTANVVVHPLPNLSFGPPSACMGTVIQFTNSSSIPVGSISSYTWAFGNGAGSNLVNPSYLYPTYGTKIVTLTALSNQGCLSSGTQSLNIFPAPEGTITPVKNGCINDQVLFNSNISIPATSISSYTWNFGDSTPLMVISSPTLPAFIAHTYTAYNTYTVGLTVLSTQNCIYNTDTVITIYPKPISSFVSSKFCFNDSTQFISTSTIPTGSISSHLWFFNDGVATSTLQNPWHQFSGSGTYTVVLSQSSLREPGLSCTHSVSNVITINPLPQTNFSTSPVCFGKVTQFANNTPTTGIIGWTWDFDSDGNPNSIFVSPTHQYPAPGTYTAVLSAKSNYSCVNTFSNLVTVYANPVATFSANEVCLGGVTNFVSQSTPGSGSTMSYSWNFGGNTGSVTATPSFTFNTPGSYPVELTVVSNLNCSSKTTSLVNVYPVPDIFVSTSSVCLNQSTQFTNLTSILSGTVVKQRWDYEGNGWDDSSSTGVMLPKIYPSSGIHLYRLEAFSDKGCKSIHQGQALVYANPNADFLTGRVCVGDNIVFSNLSSSADGSIVVYSWDFDGDNAAEAHGASPNYTFITEGNYQPRLTVTTEFGCSHSRSRPLFANPKARPAYSSDKTSGCPPLCVSFVNQSSISSGTFSTRWNFGDLSPAVSGDKLNHCFNTGIYDLTMELVSDSGCKSSLRHPGFVTVHPNPVAGFKVEPEEIDEDEPNIYVTNTATEAHFVRYFVSDGSNFNQHDFSHNLKNLDGKTKPMVVQVVRSEFGCMDTTYKVLDVKPAFTIYVPNVFTPNGDGTNDNFGAKGVGIIKFSMQIYDRWGHEVFRTNDMTITWDGTSKGSAEPIKQDVYTWKAQVVDIFNRHHDLIGHVSLIK